jgi:hypothetical protein
LQKIRIMEIIKGQSLSIVLNSDKDLTDYNKEVYVYSYPSKSEFTPDAITENGTNSFTASWTKEQTEVIPSGKLILVVSLQKNGTNYVGRAELKNIVSSKSAIIQGGDINDSEFTLNMQVDDFDNVSFDIKIGNELQLIKEIEITRITGVHHELELQDSGKLIVFMNDNPTTLIIPKDIFPIGTTITFVQYGIGKITFNNANGVIVNSALGFKVLNGQFMGAGIHFTAENEVWLFGSLTV